MIDTARPKFEKSVLGRIKTRWRTFIQCSFLTTIVLGALSIILLQLDFAIIYSAEFEAVIRTATFIWTASIIFGCVGFLSVWHEATECVNKKWEDALQEARETERYYHIWSSMAREIKEKEREILKGLNPKLLATALTVGVFTIVHTILTFSKSHPFYPLLAPSIFSIFLAATFLQLRRSKRLPKPEKA